MTVIARSSCLVARAPQPVLTALLDVNPNRWRLIAQNIREFAVFAQLVASDMQIRDSQRRFLAVLLRIAGRHTGDVTSETAELTQDELAAMANLLRQTTGRAVRELADTGLLTVRHRNIVLHDAAALRVLLAA